MKAVLLSIKPEFAHKIFNGIKKYEFRKQVFKDETIKKVVVYSSYPEQKVIGEFDIECILNDSPVILWNKTGADSGITRKFYNEYFHGRKNAYAIKVATTKKYLIEKELSDYNIFYAPQSFVYINL